jgi:hypothetical protein
MSFKGGPFEEWIIFPHLRKRTLSKSKNKILFWSFPHISFDLHVLYKNLYSALKKVYDLQKK